MPKFFSEKAITSPSEQEGCLLSDVLESQEITIDSYAEGFKYILSYERQLKGYILSGDRARSNELLNRILGKIYFASDYEFEVIVTRVCELIVVLSRAVIEGGADIRFIFELNGNCMREIRQINNLEDLSKWLSGVMHKFMDSVFAFSNAQHTDVLTKVVDYLTRNYDKRISLDDIAKLVNLSGSYLSKIFKNEMGESITGYLNAIRIERSKELLLDEKIALVDIASIVGFDDQSYFTKVFKKITGTSPGKFRQSRGLAEFASGEYPME